MTTEKGGRPAVGPQRKVRMTPDVWAWLQAKATARGTNVSMEVHRCCGDAKDADRAAVQASSAGRETP